MTPGRRAAGVTGDRPRTKSKPSSTLEEAAPAPIVRPRGWAYSPWGFLRRISLAAYEDNVFFLASALTFDALLAALPFGLLTLAALGYVAHGRGDAVSTIHAILDRFLPLSAGDTDPLVRAEQLIADVAETRGQLSILGVPLFLWFSTRFYSGVRASLNDVFDTEEERPWLVGKGIDFLLVLVSLVVIVGSTAASITLAGAPWAGRFVERLITFCMSGFLFFSVYTVAPSRKVNWDTAVVASTFSSLAFEVARVLYGIYLRDFATVDRLVSNANAIALVLGLIWMYYTAVVFLLGGEVGDTYHLMRTQREQRAILT